jgi:glycosyltransferase involved in cell wall biosynthesis
MSRRATRQPRHRPAWAGRPVLARLDRPLRIGVLAPPWYEIPPRAYGGIESMCAWLVDGLVARGHKVTLVGAGRGRTRGRFLRTFERPPTRRLGESLPEALHAATAASLLLGLDLDVVHDFSLTGPLLADSREVPTLVTVHGDLRGELGAYYRALGDQVGLVAISWAQRRGAPDLPWVGVIHSGLPVEDYPYRQTKDRFALFLGRMSPVKGAHLAIEAARASGFRLVMAGRCNQADERAYFDRWVRPRLGRDVAWLGEVDTARKKDLLSRASCLLFPIRWAEPFGLVMVEALACGTPVVALGVGAVPEVIEHGRSGLIGQRPEDLAGLLSQVGDIDPAACRKRAQSFHVAAMVKNYEALYAAAAPRQPGTSIA